METINITLLNDKEKSVTRIIKVLLITHVLIFFGAWVNHKVSLLPVLIVGPISLLYFVKPGVFKNKIVNPPYLILILVLGWTSLHVFWMAGVCMLLFIFSVQSLKKLQIKFKDDMVEMNSWPKKQYGWKDFNNIIVKDNILTLDFRNNKILQAEILNIIVSEEYFNKFANKHLTPFR